MSGAGAVSRFPAAPWPTALKVISFLGTGGLLGAGYAAYRAVPAPSGFTRAFGLGIAMIFPAVVVFALLFMVTGYAVARDALFVHRPAWSTRIALAGLTGARHDPAACRHSLRVFGNGGLYSFTGVYRSRALGRYRLFATDPKRAVVLTLGGRVVVVTPAEPETFVAHLAKLFPGVAAETTPPKDSPSGWGSGARSA